MEWCTSHDVDADRREAWACQSAMSPSAARAAASAELREAVAADNLARLKSAVKLCLDAGYSENSQALKKAREQMVG